MGAAPVAEIPFVEKKIVAPRPKLMTPQTIREDILLTAARDRAMNPPDVIPVPTKVSMASPAATINGLRDVADELEALIPALRGNEALQDDRSIEKTTRVAARVKDLRRAVSAAASDTTESSLAAVRTLGAEIGAVMAGLPTADEYAKNIRRAVIAQTDRLTTLPAEVEVSLVS